MFISSYNQVNIQLYAVDNDSDSCDRRIDLRSTTAMCLFSGCGTGCAKCDFSSDGAVTTCRGCEVKFVLKDGECKGDLYL